MKLTDWLASWWSRGRKTRRQARCPSAWYGSASVIKSAIECELLEDRSLPAAIIGLGTTSPDNLINIGGALLFNTNDGAHGNELWKTDGTAAGTSLVKDIQVGSADGVVSGLRTSVAIGTSLFFVANDGVKGVELWKSDGTAAGTVLVADINPGANGSSPQQLVNVNGTLFFTADNGVKGRELWKSDGTAAGTLMVKDISTGAASSDPAELINVAGVLFFTATDGTKGRELWKSDGTATGTVLVKDIRSGSSDSAPQFLTNVNGKLFFSAADAAAGRELWKSDGTTAGTVLVKDIRSGPSDSAPQQLANANGVLYFSANETTNGRELWKSDGTKTGTVLVKNISVGTASSNPADMTFVGSKIYFSATDGVNGRELWKTDGTAAGTTLVKDILVGTSPSNPTSFVSLNGRLWFTAQESTHGRELWVSDGSAANTQWVQDLSVGSGSSEPRELTSVGTSGTLMFSADGGTGRKLWSMDTTQVPTAFGQSAVSLAKTSGSQAASQFETNSGSAPIAFNVFRTGDLREASRVDFAVTASGANAASASDFGGAWPSGTINFAPGESQTTLSINMSGDSDVETDERFVVTLSNPVGSSLVSSILGTVASATGTILNDDTALSIAPLSASKAEGNSGYTPFTFTVTRTGNTSGASSANYTVRGSGANPAASADFGGTLPSGSVNFAAGETSKTITINVAGNKAVEPDDEFTVTLSGPTGATLGTASAIGTILNDDSSFAIADVSQLEGNSGSTPITFTVTRDGVINQTGSVQVRVDLRTGAGKADATDFITVPPTTTLSFAARETFKTFTINVAGDNKYEPDEEFAVSMINPINGTLKTSVATGTILNDDQPPTLSIAASNASRNEGNSGQTAFDFTITRTGDPSGTASVTYVVTGNGDNPADASDFGGTLPNGTVNFAAGETSRTLTINVTGDMVIEPDESFIVTLSSATGASLGTSTATGTILNDDSSLSITANNATQPEGDSGNTPFTFTVTRSGDLRNAVSTYFTVTGSGYNDDYDADATDFGGTWPSGTINFAEDESSKTITINVTGDTTEENDQSFTVTLSNPSAGSLGTVAASATILSDDSSIRISWNYSYLVEGNSGAISLSYWLYRDWPYRTTIAVNYTITGSGLHPADGGDFGGTLPSGQITFAPGESSKNLIVSVSSDTLAEFDESFTATFSTSTGRALEAATTTILDDDLTGSSPWVVDTLTDEVDGDVTPGHVSLREAITRSNYFPDKQTITFAPSLTANGPATITLINGVLNISDVDILGPTESGLTISGNHQSSILFISGSNSTISNLTFEDGKGQSGYGGAILNAGRTTLVDCTFVGNETQGRGGAILNSGDLTLVNSTLSGNRADFGGAIFNSPNASLKLQQSTITGNVSNIGGGINNDSNYAFGSRKVYGNDGFSDWQGYYIWEFGSVSVSNSIVAGNSSVSDPSQSDFGGATDHISTTNSLIGDWQTSPDFDVATVLDPVLADNGGPTKTHALIAGSPAINAGALGLIPADSMDLDGNGNRTEPMPFDQRGASFARVLDGLPDLGAVEFDPSQPTVNVSISSAAVTEDGSENLVFTFTRNLTNGPLTVKFGVSGSATMGADASLSGMALASGQITSPAANAVPLTNLATFADGASTATITVDPTPDLVNQADESIVLTLLHDRRYSLGRVVSATGFIVNDDLAPIPTTPELIDIGVGAASPDSFVSVNGSVYFFADDGTHGRELWKSDGTTVGTLLVKDVQPGSAGSAVSGLTRSLATMGNTVFFVANDGVSGAELWKSDGTGAGTLLVSDLNKGSNGSSPQQLTVVNNTLFFTADDGVHGRELWQTDGTTAGTVLVSDIATATGVGSDPTELLAIRSTLFFTASNSTNGRELWKANLTNSGRSATSPTIVKDIRSGNLDSAPQSLTNVNGRLFFTATDGVKGRELWTSDGTSAGTALVKDIRAGSSDSAPLQLAAINGQLWFSANDGTNGRELWKSDGTSIGTVLVKNLNAGTGSSNPADITQVGNSIFLTANDGGSGRELWKTDGTAAGTAMVTDIFAGVDHANPQSLVSLNGRLWFTATEGAHGRELWTSDGTAANTSMVSDLVPGLSDSSPNLLTTAAPNNRLFFVANDASQGLELFVQNTPAASIAAGNSMLSVAAVSTSRPEGTNGRSPFTFLLTRQGDTSSPASVSYAITGNGMNAANADDFGGSWPTGTVTFAVGETTKVLAINVSGDSTVEPDEGFLLTLSNPTGANLGMSTAAGLILNDDTTVSITATNASLPEGDYDSTPFTFTVTRTGNLDSASSVQFVINGTGVNPTTKSDLGLALNPGVIRFAPGETSQTLTINVRGDNTVEADETFSVSLLNPTDAYLGSSTATGTILNDDTGLSIAATDATKPEGNSGNTPFTFTVTRTGNTSGTSSVDFSVPGQSRYDDEFYVDTDATDFGGSLPSGTLSFAAGETSITITINVSGDAFAEPNENFRVTLLNSVGANILNSDTFGTILNEDTSLLIDAASANKPEGNSDTTPFTFTISRTGVSTGTSSVDFAVQGSGTNAANALDFGGTLPSGTVTFAAGETYKTITINVSGDTTFEPEETFTVTLSHNVGATLDLPTATGTIQDDDEILTVDTLVDESDGNFSPGDFSLSEAIEQANAKSGIQTIVFAPSLTANGPATITLNGKELLITSDLNIIGPGADKLTINANQRSRVLEVSDNSYYVAKVVSISGMTLTGAKSSGVYREGGGIFNSELLKITDSVITGNVAESGGGGIYSRGTLNIERCVISNNTAPHEGGGIFSAGLLTISDSTVSGNSICGGIEFGGVATINRCTFTGNSSNSSGGAISSRGTLTVTQSTLSGNTAGRQGGGLFSYGQSTITQSTITGNTSSNGGGISQYDNRNGHFVMLSNSVVAGNTSLDGMPNDIAGRLDQDATISTPSHYNIIGDPRSAGGLTNGVNGNIVGAVSSSGERVALDVTSILDTALANNGGPTKTHALVVGGLAVDAGDNDSIGGAAFDQRGTGFPRIVGARVDIGAVEVGLTPFSAPL
ncbi:MAG: hypothetical protein NT013_14210 [Planctomycetia bacterium]|nr:hypothetical protein [Planctomycetia bacterium]